MRSRLGAGVAALAVLETDIAFERVGSRNAKLSSLLDVWTHKVSRCLRSTLTSHKYMNNEMYKDKPANKYVDTYMHICVYGYLDRSYVYN